MLAALSLGRRLKKDGVGNVMVQLVQLEEHRYHWSAPLQPTTTPSALTHITEPPVMQENRGLPNFVRPDRDAGLSRATGASPACVGIG
jgi:hypothetical protein